jgi:hypothetical protein
MMIHGANLDAMGGRAVATIKAHTTSIKHSIYNCQLLRKTPTIPSQGPMAMADMVGMGLAVKLLFHSLNTVLCIKGEPHIHFDSMRRPPTTYTSAWESSPMGIHEGLTYSSNSTRVTITSCPTQQKHVVDDERS